MSVTVYWKQIKGAPRSPVRFPTRKRAENYLVYNGLRRFVLSIKETDSNDQGEVR